MPFQVTKKETSINSQNFCITQTQIQSDETIIGTNISSLSVVHSDNADVRVFLYEIAIIQWLHIKQDFVRLLWII